MMKVKLEGNLNKVIEQLIDYQKKRMDVYTLFEGHALFSKNISYDVAYLTVHGVTYFEYLRNQGYDERGILLESLEPSLRDPKVSRSRMGRFFVPRGLIDEWDLLVDRSMDDEELAKAMDLAITIVTGQHEGYKIEEVDEFLDKHKITRETYESAKQIALRFQPAIAEFLQQLDELRSRRTLLTI